MAIIRRSVRPSHYTVIDNLVLQDKRMSWKAQGLLTYLLSLPDSWQVNIKHLAKERPDGKESTLSGLKELKALGYLKKICVRDDRGRVLRWETQVFDLPQLTEDDDPETQKPRNRETQILDNPHSGKPGHIDITYSNKDLDQKENEFTESDFSLSENSKNLEDLDENQNLIPDQQQEKLEDQRISLKKKENCAKERKDAPPQNWSEQQILSTWNANRPKSWLPYSIGTLISPAVQNGLDHILQNFGDGDRAKTCEIIAITLKYVSSNDAWLSSQRFTAKQSLSLEHGAGNKRFLGDYVPAALQALENANKPQSVERSPLPLPTANNIFFSQIKELL